MYNGSNEKWKLFKKINEESNINDTITKWKNASKRSLIRQTPTHQELLLVFAIPEISERFSEDEVFLFAMNSIHHCQAILSSGFCDNKPDFKERVESCRQNLNLQRHYRGSGF